MTTTDQTAHWIAPFGSEKTANFYFRARRKFKLAQVPESCRIQIAAESLYQVWVNGQYLGQGPARGTKTRNFMDGYEIGPLLKTGDNWIAVLVGCANVPSFKSAPFRPGVFVHSDEIAFGTDALWEVQIAQDWRPDVPVYTFQMGYLEWRDLGQEPVGWQTGLNSDRWAIPEVVWHGPNLGDKLLLPRDVPLLRTTPYKPQSVLMAVAVPPLTDPRDTQIAQILTTEAHRPWAQADEIVHTVTRLAENPMTILPVPNGSGVSFIVDFGREITGGFVLDLDAPQGTIVDLGYEEQMREGRLKLFFETHAAPYAFADRYIAPGGRVTLGPTLAERGFRMVQVTLRGFSEPITLFGIAAEDRRYPTPTGASFQCSDPLLTQIWNASVETISACTTDVFIDCPWRESAFWVNDLIVENVTWLQAFGDARVNARALRLALSQGRADGLAPGVCPTTGDDSMVLPATNLFFPTMLEEYQNYSGDPTLLAELIGPIKTIFGAVSAWEDADELLTPPSCHWNFVEWSFCFGGPGLDGHNTAVVNWFYVTALATMARLLRRLDLHDEADTWHQKAVRVAAALDRKFWRIEERCYAEWLPKDGETVVLGSQLTHALALLSGLLPEERIADCTQALTRPDLLTSELYLSHLVLRALAAQGRGREVLPYVRRYWGPIIEAGSPTIWEANVYEHGKAAFGQAGSLCHGFATGPISVFQTFILGIAPLEPGFRTFRFAPHAADLQEAEGTVPTPQGAIQIAWHRQDDLLHVSLHIPVGTVACLPDGQFKASGPHQFTLPVEIW